MKLFKNFRVDRQYRDVIFDASVLGLHMVSHTLVGGAAGYFLDRWLGTKPTLFMIFLVLGIVAGFRSMVQDARKMLRKLKNSDQRSEGETGDDGKE